MPTSLLKDPEVLVAAIQVLTWAIILVGGSLVSVILYVWSRTDGKVDRIAASLEQLTLSTSVELAALKATCKANHPD